MVTSTQITQMLNDSPNPLAAMHKMWERTRYLVAQEPAASDYSETIPGYFKGRVVIPGPKANPKLSDTLSENDLGILMDRHHIRFIDNRTTENASEDIRRASYTIMGEDEANEYERLLTAYYAANRPKTVPSATA